MGALATIIWATGSFWIPLMFGLVFLILPMPDIAVLRSYYKTKYLMSFAYLLFAVVSFYFLVTNSGFQFNKTIRVSTPSVAILQIIIFTYVNITLINPSFLKFRKLLRPLIPAFILCIAYFFAFTNDPGGKLYQVMYYSLFGFFAVLLVIYSFMFYRHYKLFRLRMNNYYSEESSSHLLWVAKSQIFVTITGILAFFAGFIPTGYMGYFLAVMILFFAYYAIRYIYYANSFSVVEAVLDVNQEKEIKNNSVDTAHSQLDEAISKWEIEKKYLERNLTVENVAISLCTNRTYLSNFINTQKNKTFNEWINGLRINEARQLLLNNPDMPILEVCELVGFSDKSNFGRHFTKITGYSPAACRKEHSNPNNNS